MAFESVVGDMYEKAIVLGNAYLEEVNRIAVRHDLSDRETYELAVNFISELYYE